MFALEVLKAGELALLLVVGKLIVASHARVALLQAADGFINLGSRPQSTQRDTLSQLFNIGQKADLLLLAYSAVFLCPAFAPAQGDALGAGKKFLPKSASRYLPGLPVPAGPPVFSGISFPLSTKVSAAELRQKRNRVGAGPSSKTCPRCAPHRAQRISMRCIP